LGKLRIGVIEFEAVPASLTSYYPTMSSSSGTPESWISSFCSLLGHEYFAEISEDFIEDDFNLTGLQTQVAMYKEALEVCFEELYDICFC
jgi:casein kinase II subunit beta